MHPDTGAGIIQSMCCSRVDSLGCPAEPPAAHHARQPRPPILGGSTPRRDDGYEEHGEAGADFAMIGHLHEQRKQLLATIEQSESELGSVVLQLSSLESGGGLF